MQLLDATLALVRLGDAVMQRYGAAKARQAALDFDDLVGKAASLLRSSGAVEWVLYKLDGGLDHILVDEAQDTSPVQWHVIRALAEEFFSGHGTSDKPRTLFAVGDEKQSIYSFQGAAPAMFAAAGDEFEERAARAGMRWRRVPLTLSFRSVEPLLAAVDRIFAKPERTPGPDRGARARQPRRQSRRTCGIGRDLAAGALSGGYAGGALVAAGGDGRFALRRASGRAHCGHHSRMARQPRDAALTRATHPRRRYSDPGAQACAVRAGHGFGTEGARYRRGRRRPPHADRADRRAGSGRAGRFPEPAR